MFRSLCAVVLAILPFPALADFDEINSVPAQAFIGKTYVGEYTPSRIRFINVRDRPVKIVWVAFDGSERIYATLAEGQEMVQPTYVAHRWVIKDADDGTPLEGFISTRSAFRDNGTAQIALIR